MFDTLLDVASRLRYLVAVDFSRRSRRAMTVARQLARRTGARLVAAHVRPSSDVRAAVLEDRGDLLRHAAGSLRTSMAAHYARRLGALIQPAEGEEALLLAGSPEIALCREARRGYDLLVMGSHGHGAVSSLFLGSTAQRVLSRTSVPVLVVPVRRP